MSGDELLALAACCEAASGPDRELDGAIDRLLHTRPANGNYNSEERAFWRVKNGWSGLLIRASDGFARDSFCAREYTAWLDAAMTLVPEGYHMMSMEDRWQDRRWRVFIAKLPTPAQISRLGEGKTFGVDTWKSEAVTSALALTAAALRARAAGTVS